MATRLFSLQVPKCGETQNSYIKVPGVRRGVLVMKSEHGVSERGSFLLFRTVHACHVTDGLRAGLVAGGDALVREPPLLVRARRPDDVDAEKMLAQCLAKCEVECLGEFLTADDRPLDDVELIRKNIFVATDENIGTGATFGGDPSLAWLGEDQLCEPDATLEEQVSEALVAVIEETKTISSQEQPRELQSANTFEDPTARQPSVVEQTQSRAVLTLTQPDDEPGDTDDDKCPDLGHPAKVATPRNGQGCQEQENAEDGSEFIDCEKDTLSMPSTFGATADDCSIVSNAEFTASGPVVSEHEITSGPEGSLVNYAEALRKPPESEEVPGNPSQPAESAADGEKLAGDGTEETAAVRKPCPTTKVEQEIVHESGFTEEVSAIAERSIKDLNKRENSPHAHRLSITAVTCVDKKDNVAIVAPRTVNQLHSEAPFPAIHPENVMKEPELVEFNAIFECDWDGTLPESSEPDITFGTSAAVEFEPSPYITDDFASDAKSVQRIDCSQEKRKRQTERTAIRHSTASPPSKRSVMTFERGVSLTPLSERTYKATHGDKEVVHCSKAYSIGRGVETSSVRSNSPQIRTGVNAVGSSAAFSAASPLSWEEENEKVGTKPRAKMCYESKQDALEEGWSAEIFKAMPGDIAVAESTADRWDTTGNIAFGSPVLDCPIIDEERITLQPLAEDETVDASLSANIGHNVRRSEQMESPRKCSSAKNSGYIYSNVPEDLLEEGSPRRKVRFERLKENVSRTKLGASGKIGDWYKPLSGNAEQQMRIGTNGGSSTFVKGKQQRNTRMLDSSGVFRNKRKRKPLCDQSNRITRYFPAKKCAGTVPLALYGDKASNAGACHLPDLAKFRYNRMEARSSTPVNGSASAYGMLNEAEDHHGCSTNVDLRDISFGRNLLGSSDMSDSADAGTAYSCAARNNAVTVSLGATSNIRYAGYQIKPSLLGVDKQPAHWENDPRKVPDMLGVGHLTQSADTVGGIVKDVSRYNVYRDNYPVMRAGTAANCSETSPGSQMPPVRTRDASCSRMLGAKRNMTEDDREVSQELEVAFNAQLPCERELSASTEKQGNRISGFPRGFIGSRSTDKGEFCFERRPQQQTGRAIPGQLRCTNTETGYRYGVCHANREVSDSGVPPSESSNGFYEAVTLNGISVQEAPEQRNAQGQAFQGSPAHAYRGVLENPHDISTGEREHDLFEGRDVFDDVTPESDANASRWLGRERDNGPFQDNAVDTYSGERFFFDGLGDYNTDGRVAQAERGMATRRDNSWDRGDGATVRATEEDERRVLQIIQDTLRGPVLQTLGRSSASQKARVTLTPKCPATPLSNSARQHAVAAEESASSSTNIGVPDSAVVQQARPSQGAAAATVAPITATGQDSTRGPDREEARKSAHRWPGHLNVRNLAAKLVAPQQDRKQVDRTAIEQLLKPPKSNNPLANSFMAIRGVKLQGPDDVGKSPKW
ncbi:uncharacterized protein LOC125941263 [Dermacentor silvarum]|uniref:uncharacterized protein LOC125941263 n=1 Tax=Dermacentor silvarum TaxID=543639 RepID=UPI002101495D|nr:uncharacterized protein LOC125941263 [Dermacentor silvarum]